METPQQWIEENRPDDDPDYRRLADVTDALESEMRKSGSKEVLNRRFDYGVAMKYALRRTEETSRETKLENPDWDVLLDLLRKAWAEGFAFGSLAYAREHRGREAEALLDRIALANVNHMLATADQDTMDPIFSRAVSPKALRFVSTVRSIRATQALHEVAPVTDHQMIGAVAASQWLDAFLVGLVFEEMGGHQEGV